jgi:hypothetical protein
VRFEIADWCFDIDITATEAATTQNSTDHCECAYCKNYYETVEITYPALCGFLKSLGINLNGPSELMPFEPTLMLACYRIQGSVIQWGEASLAIGGIPLTVELGEIGSFLLWVGEMELPWVQNESVEDVISPANLPDFLSRMRDVWLLRHGDDGIYC